MKTSTIKVYRDLLEVNGEWAAETRRLLAAHRVAMVNLIGAPGCGKTRLLECLADELSRDFRFSVLEGDPETTRDAERLQRLGVPVVQLITSGGCHLDAQLVHAAVREQPLERLDLLIVENVGNLMCPACFDIGEDAKVALLSVTEGEDKPLKYPLLFQEAKAVIITKLDLLPHLEFDMDTCLEFIRRVHGARPVFPLSARSGVGLPAWQQWLKAVVENRKTPEERRT